MKFQNKQKLEISYLGEIVAFVGSASPDILFLLKENHFQLIINVFCLTNLVNLAFSCSTCLHILLCIVANDARRTMKLWGGSSRFVRTERKVYFFPEYKNHN